MRRVLVLFCALALVLPAGGCLKSTDAITLNKGGGGTISSTMVVHMKPMREILVPLAPFINTTEEQLAKTPDVELGNAEHPSWFRLMASKVKGYEITSASQKIADGKRSTSVAATFNSLEVAARGGAFYTSSVALSKVEKSEKAPKGAWKLTFKDALAGADPSMMQGMDPAQMLGMFEAQLKKTLSLKRSVCVPTKILETNGKKSEDGKTVSWEINYDKILEGKDLTMSITFEAADGLNLKAFTYAPDQQVLQQRLFQKPPGLRKPAKKRDDEPGSAGEEGGDEEPPEKKDDEKKDTEKKKDPEKKDEPATPPKKDGG